MNYAGFTRPLWQWLKAPGPVPFQPGPSRPRRAFRVTAHALTLVGSHDTMRVRTLLQDPGLVTVAFGLLATMPGIPMLWAGDVIGQEGVNGEDGRRPIPWNNREWWDMERLATNRALFAARADNVALRRGGLRWLAVQDDSLTFLRESPEQTILVHAARADHRPVRIPATVLGHQFDGLADLHPDGSDRYTLPSGGPLNHLWSCPAPRRRSRGE